MQAVRRWVRQYTFRLVTLDVRGWYIQETLRRMRNLIQTAGGELSGGAVPLPLRRRVFCVLRSPFVHKKSREHFEMVWRQRLVKWRYEVSGNVDDDVAHRVAMETPPNWSVRVTEEQPGLLALAHYFMEKPPTSMESDGREAPSEKGAVADVVASPTSMESDGREAPSEKGAVADVVASPTPMESDGRGAPSQKGTV
ncbi:hypothetical protein CDCA_CDCA05G1576 [Cyanidium caldarium]|uniref:Small ribosomal subunit protein uS10 domain-containing protein n=1 Tax=Cyanidium caldarium TaxID=2771 RepID=A0AAV9ITP8_CYACA|nr:hypothetical protein CDCA_CDCA05G1576 [Cyanidium caldarium]